MVVLLAFLPACELVDPEDGEDGNESRLRVVTRSATTLSLQWDAIGSGGRYTVDHFTAYSTCDFPPLHSNVFEVSGTSVTLTGLAPATRYHIHVHDIPNYSGSTNIVMVSTLEAGMPEQPVAAADYTICD